MQTIRIFISSPGDVRDERQIAGKVIERIQGKYWSFVRLDDVFWEEKVVRATAHYQDELINPGRCEVVVGVLWSRLGSPLPAKFQKQAGPSNTTGTEWELEEAFAAYKSSLALAEDPVKAKPDILIYRCGAARPKQDDPKKDAEAADQETALNQYLDANYFHQDEHHTIKRPIASYQTLEEFEKKLAGDLEQLILRCIPSLKSGYDPPPISGSPFKGLHAFDFSDSDRYFGRNREIRVIQDRLRSRAVKDLPFVLIYGGSGYGKSSLMRAGLATIITRPGGSVDEIGLWRRVVLQPSLGQGPLCERLSRVLFQTFAPEEVEYARLHGDWPLPGLPEIVETPQENQPGQTWDLAGFARCLADEEDRAFAVLGVRQTLERLDRHLLLQIDQLEEIFTTPGITDGHDAFFRAIGDLCLTGRVWCVATLRSEYFPRIAEESILRDLVGRDGGYILTPPDRQSLREIIRFPALAARLDYQRRIGEVIVAGEPAKYEFLDEQILADAEISADALPLLEFTLQRLYDQRANDLLTWGAYAAFGGLKGAIGRRANDVYLLLSPSAREARHSIFASLVRVDALRGTVVRQRAPLGVLRAKPRAGEFLDAFLAAHLLVTDEEAGQPVVTFAHEALISHWDALAAWTTEHRSDLLARQRLREQTDLWRKNDGKRSYLLSEGRLAEATHVAANPIFHLDEDEREFLRLSTQRAKGKLRFFQSAAAVFALLAVGAAILGWSAKKSAKLAKSETKHAEAESKRAEAENVRNKKLLHDASMADYGIAVRKLQSQEEWHEGMAHLARALDLEPANTVAAWRLWATLATRANLPRQIYRNVYSASFSPDGARIVTKRSDDSDSVRIWDAATGNPLGNPLGHEVQGLHSIIVTDEFHASFSPDGARIIALADGSSLRVWDAATGAALGELLHHGSIITSASFSPDSSRIVTASWDKTARVWDAATGKPLSEPLRHEDKVFKAAFSPDGARIVTASADRTARVWDATAYQALGEPMRHTNIVLDAEFSPDGARIVTASADNTARIWDSATGKPFGEPLAHENQVVSASFSPDGSRIVTASRDFTARVWDAATGAPLGEPLHHKNQVTSANFSPDGAKVVTAGWDNTARVWDAATGKALGEPLRHGTPVTSASFSPDGCKIITMSLGLNACVWDAATRKPLGEPLPNEAGVTLANFSKDGSKVLTINGETTLDVWDAASKKRLGEPMRHDARIIAAVFSPDGSKIVTAADDQINPATRSVCLWDVATGKALCQPIHPGVPIYGVNFSPDGSKIAVATFTGARVWDAKTGKALGEAMRHDEKPNSESPYPMVGSASFSPDGSRIVTAGRDGTARVWEAATGKPLGEPMRQANALVRATFSPDGSKILTIGIDDAARVWDASTRKPLGEPLLHEDWLHSAMFSPDSSKIVTASRDKTVRIWDAATCKALGSPLLHEEEVQWAEFTPNGSQIVTTTSDHNCLWDVATGEIERETLLHDGLMNAGIFSPDGSKVVAVNSDKTARLWDISTQIRPELPVPDWIPQFARGIAGFRFEPDGELVEMTLDERWGVFREAHDGKDAWSRLARWVAAPSELTTTIYPDSRLTARQIAESDRDLNSKELLKSALECDPGVPLAHLMLARFEENPQRAELLRKFEFNSLPEDAALWARAANELARQKDQRILQLEAARHAERIAGHGALVLRAFAVALNANHLRAEAMKTYESLLSSNEAGNSDFAEAGFLAATLGQGDRARQIFRLAEERFPTTPVILRAEGFALLTLHAPEEALKAFVRYEPMWAATRKRSPQSFQALQWTLAGLSASRWMSGDSSGAVIDYQRLIGRNAQWAKADFITSALAGAADNLPDAEDFGQTLKKILAETLKQYPALQTKPAP